jgi:hypothetical protein
LSIVNSLMTEIKNSKAFLVTSLAILLAIGVVGTTITISTSARASAYVASTGYTGAADENNQIPTVVTKDLEGEHLKTGQFLLISDITPVRVDQAHIALNVPCHVEQGSTTPKSDITVVAGVAPDVKKVHLTYIPQLSTPTKNCTFHADIPDDVKGNSNAEVTDIAIINKLSSDVSFGSGNFVTLSISAVHSEEHA